MHWLPGVTPTSCYDTSALKYTLERLVDFDRINGREIRFGVGAVNVRTGRACHGALGHAVAKVCNARAIRAWPIFEPPRFGDATREPAAARVEPSRRRVLELRQFQS